jgi:glucan-binding YG repeat protein
MRLWEKLIIPAAAFALALAFTPSTALASTDLIDSVTIDVDSSISSGDSGSDADNSVSASTDDDEYKITSIKVTNEPSGEWKDSSKPKLEIILTAKSGYAFYVDGEKISKDDITIDGVSGEVTSVSVSSSSKKKATIKYTMDALDSQDDSDDDGSYDLDVSNLEWNETTGRASWDGADDANKYEVKLYRGGSLLTSVTTTDTHYSFASYFTSSGRYQFRVRAVKNSSHKGSWESSDYFTVTSSEASTIKSKYSSSSSSSDSSSSSGPSSDTSGPAGASTTGAWLKDSTGWWYCNADKSYTVNNWQQINGKWYYFNGSGYMVTGWQKVGNYWYYLDPTNGNMMTGWQKVGNYYYYLSESHDGYYGRMYANERTPDGYYVNSDGVWVS